MTEKIKRPECPAWCRGHEPEDIRGTTHYGSLGKAKTGTSELHLWALQDTDPNYTLGTFARPRLFIRAEWASKETMLHSAGDAEGLAEIMDQLGHKTVGKAIRDAAAIVFTDPAGGGS